MEKDKTFVMGKRFGEAAISGADFNKVSTFRIYASAITSRALTLLYSVIGFTIALLLWSVLSTYSPDFPGPRSTLKTLFEMVRDPFYVYGPNDMGIGIQLWSSLVRVFYGF